MSNEGRSSYLDRVRHFTRITDPRTLFYSRAELYRCKQIVECGVNKNQNISTPDYEHAKKLVDSSFHPDTGDLIFLPFRIASFVPTNMVVVAGMLTPNPTRVGILFWQWLNQSVNVAFNYANANKSASLPLRDAVTAYGVSVAASCGIALSLHKFATAGGGRLLNGGRFIPFAAVAAAGTANVFLMRRNELRDGISISDPEDAKNRTIGRSKVAAQSALLQTAVSRVATAFPCLALTPLAMAALQKTELLKRHPRLIQPLNFCLIGASLMVALPFAIGIFPQHAVVNSESLEPELHDKVSEVTGKRLAFLKYNKGL